MSADGKITVEERDMLQDAVEEMGVAAAEEMPAGAEDLDVFCSSITSPQARVIMLLELASFAFVDSDYDAREQGLLRAVAKIWQMDLISVLRIEHWAESRVALAREAAEIMHEVDAFSTQQGAPD